jgi:terminal uridylyltransferase
MAATTQSSLRSSIPNHHAHQSNNTAVAHSQLPPHHQPSQPRGDSASKQNFLLEFSQCLVDFVVQLLPTIEELAVKEDVRKLLERLIRTIEPESRLLSFGSTANGFSLRNSGPSTHTLPVFLCGGVPDASILDMDLCCLIDSDERTTASNLVTLLGDLLERGKAISPDITPHNSSHRPQKLSFASSRCLMLGYRSSN